MMINLIDIESHWQKYQWFRFYEFDILDNFLSEKSDTEILIYLLSKNMFDNFLNSHSGNLEKLKIDESKKYLLTLKRPFVFSEIQLEDINIIKNLTEFKSWIKNFREDGWESDYEDAQILIDRALNTILKKCSIENGLWHLSKDKFHEKSKKLKENYWFYIHFEFFIEIDRETQRIRMFDFGYD